MYIPEHIKIKDSYYNIEVGDIVMTDNNIMDNFYQIANDKIKYIMGYICSSIKKIKIRISCNNKLQCFWHECIHGILIENGRYDINKDEKLIDIIAFEIQSIQRQQYDYLFDNLINGSKKLTYPFSPPGIAYIIPSSNINFNTFL